MRLFLAIDLPAEVREALRAVQERLRDSVPGWRWLAPDAVHLTVRFLGEVAEQDHRPQLAAWRRAAAGAAPLALRLGGAGVFPSPRRARVLWIGVEERSGAGGLTALAERVELAAREQGFAAEERRFRPHLTIARARRGSPARPPAEEVEVPSVVFDVGELTLFRSQLRPTGAEYTRLERFRLGG